MGKRSKKKVQEIASRNYVAKHSLTFNKASVEPDKKKESKRGKTKHIKEKFKDEC